MPKDAGLKYLTDNIKASGLKYLEEDSQDSSGLKYLEKSSNTNKVSRTKNKITAYVTNQNINNIQDTQQTVNDLPQPYAWEGVAASAAELPLNVSDLGKAYYDFVPAGMAQNYISGGNLKKGLYQADDNYAKFAGANNREEFDKAIEWGTNKGVVSKIMADVLLPDAIATKGGLKFTAKLSRHVDKGLKFMPTSANPKIYDPILKGTADVTKYLKDEVYDPMLIKTQMENGYVNMPRIIKGKAVKWDKAINAKNNKVDKAIGKYDSMIKGYTRALNEEKGLKVTPEQIKELMPFIRERTGLPEALKIQRPDLTDLYKVVNKKYVAGIADEAVNKIAKPLYTEYKKTHGIPMEKEVKNHLSHFWDAENKISPDDFFYTDTASKLDKPRSVKSYKDGIDYGLEPKTLDFIEILKKQSRSLIKATENKKLYDFLDSLEQDGVKLIEDIDNAPAEWEHLSYPEEGTTVFKELVGKKVRPDIKSILDSINIKPAKKITKKTQSKSNTNNNDLQKRVLNALDYASSFLYDKK